MGARAEGGGCEGPGRKERRVQKERRGRNGLPRVLSVVLTFLPKKLPTWGSCLEEGRNVPKHGSFPHFIPSECPERALSLAFLQRFFKRAKLFYGQSQSAEGTLLLKRSWDYWSVQNTQKSFGLRCTVTMSSLTVSSPMQRASGSQSAGPFSQQQNRSPMMPGTWRKWNRHLLACIDMEEVENIKQRFPARSPIRSLLT